MSSKFVLLMQDKTVLVSYSTAVVVIADRIANITNEYYSVTTTKHVNQFLKERASEFDNLAYVGQDVINTLAEFVQVEA